MPNENAEDYDAFRAGILDQLDPCGYLEEALADRMMADLWRLKRIPAIEDNVYRRDRDAHRVSEAYQEVRDLTISDNRGMILPDTPRPKITDNAAREEAQKRLTEERAKMQNTSYDIVRSFEESAATFANLGRHEAALSRSFQRTHHELLRLLAARAGQYVPAPAAVDVNVNGVPSTFNENEPPS